MPIPKLSEIDEVHLALEAAKEFLLATHHPNEFAQGNCTGCYTLFLIENGLEVYRTRGTVDKVSGSGGLLPMREAGADNPEQPQEVLRQMPAGSEEPTAPGELSAKQTALRWYSGRQEEGIASGR